MGRARFFEGKARNTSYKSVPKVSTVMIIITNIGECRSSATPELRVQQAREKCGAAIRLRERPSSLIRPMGHSALNNLIDNSCHNSSYRD